MNPNPPPSAFDRDELNKIVIDIAEGFGDQAKLEAFIYAAIQQNTMYVISRYSEILEAIKSRELGEGK